MAKHVREKETQSTHTDTLIEKPHNDHDKCYRKFANLPMGNAGITVYVNPILSVRWRVSATHCLLIHVCLHEKFVYIYSIRSNRVHHTFQPPSSTELRTSKPATITKWMHNMQLFRSLNFSQTSIFCPSVQSDLHLKVEIDWKKLHQD